MVAIMCGRATEKLGGGLTETFASLQSQTCSVERMGGEQVREEMRGKVGGCLRAGVREGRCSCDVSQKSLMGQT